MLVEVTIRCKKKAIPLKARALTVVRTTIGKIMLPPIMGFKFATVSSQALTLMEFLC